MTLPLIVFLLAAVIPVFFGKIRSAPLWLCLQAAMLGWNGIAQHAGLSVDALLALLEIIVMRVFIAPILLRRTIHRRAEPNLDLMPSNLFAWAIATALIVLAFEFGGASVADIGALTQGVVGATVMIALLILSTNDSPTAQLVALLFMENALALFESLLPEQPVPVHVALGIVYVVTVGVGSWLLGTHAAAEAPANQEPPKEVQ
jgi:hydrogenase-4 membrane subunit HyfE